MAAGMYRDFQRRLARLQIGAIRRRWRDAFLERAESQRRDSHAAAHVRVSVRVSNLLRCFTSTDKSVCATPSCRITRILLQARVSVAQTLLSVPVLGRAEKT